MKKVLLAVATIVGFSAALIACNKDGGGGGSSAPVTTPQACSTLNNQPGGTQANTCGTANYVNTQYGCLPMWQSNPCYGNYNGQQIPVTGGNFNYGPGNINGYGYNYNNSYNYNGYAGYNGYQNSGFYPYYTYQVQPQPVPLVPGFMGAGFQAGIWFH